MLIDTHCHLNFKAFKNNLDTVVKDAKKAGVGKIIVPGASLNSSLKAVKLAKKFNNIYAAVGIHPIHVSKEIKKLNIQKLKQKLIELANHKKVMAIGECGLDFYHQHYQALKTIQEKIFLMQIKIAHKLNLPLIIHSRKASDELIKLIKSHKSLTKNSGVFHCFQGESKLLKKILKLNFYLGINGLATYNTKLQKSIKNMPLNNILLETDAPFLIPKPLKLKKNFPNEPKNVKIVAEKIALLKGDSFFNIARQTTNNACSLFKLKRC